MNHGSYAGARVLPAAAAVIVLAPGDRIRNGGWGESAVQLGEAEDRCEHYADLVCHASGMFFVCDRPHDGS